MLVGYTGASIFRTSLTVPAVHCRRRVDRRIVSDAPVRPRPLRFLGSPTRSDRHGATKCARIVAAWTIAEPGNRSIPGNASGVRRPVTRAQRMQGCRGGLRPGPRPARRPSRAGDTNMFSSMLSALVITLMSHAVLAQAPAPNVVATESTITATVDRISDPRGW